MKLFKNSVVFQMSINFSWKVRLLLNNFNRDYEYVFYPKVTSLHYFKYSDLFFMKKILS